MAGLALGTACSSIPGNGTEASVRRMHTLVGQDYSPLRSARFLVFVLEDAIFISPETTSAVTRFSIRARLLKLRIHQWETSDLCIISASSRIRSVILLDLGSIATVDTQPNQALTFLDRQASQVVIPSLICSGFAMIFPLAAE